MGSRLLWLLVPAALVASAPAHAEPTAQQKELARDLMQKGHAARDAHDLKLALESFKGADDVMHVPTTAFEVARSQSDLGLLVEAHETLLGILRSPEKPGEPQAFHDARGYAKVLDDELAGRIPQIRIKVDGVAPGRSVAVSVDGVALPDGALLVPYKVDPGHHVVTAKSEGAQGRAEADVAERQTVDVSVALAASAPSSRPEGPGEVGGAPSTAPPEAAPGAEGGGGRRIGPIAWVGFGVGAAGLVTGTVTGIMTISQKGSIASQCNGNRCPPSTYDSLSSANTIATVSTASFVVAGAGAGVGLAAWLLGGDRPAAAPASAPATARVHVVPWLGVGSAGVAGSF